VVYKALNADTGKFIAVKVLARQIVPQDWGMSFESLVKREIEILSNISHVSKITDIIYVRITDE
jgi:serine/threonine protein kinase